MSLRTRWLALAAVTLLPIAGIFFAVFVPSIGAPPRLSLISVDTGTTPSNLRLMVGMNPTQPRNPAFWEDPKMLVALDTSGAQTLITSGLSNCYSVDSDAPRQHQRQRVGNFSDPIGHNAFDVQKISGTAYSLVRIRKHDTRYRLLCEFDPGKTRFRRSFTDLQFKLATFTVLTKTGRVAKAIGLPAGAQLPGDLTIGDIEARPTSRVVLALENSMPDSVILKNGTFLSSGGETVDTARNRSVDGSVDVHWTDETRIQWRDVSLLVLGLLLGVLSSCILEAFRQVVEGTGDLKQTASPVSGPRSRRSLHFK